mgnify:FL=1
MKTYDVYKSIAEEGKTRFKRKKDKEIYSWDKYCQELEPENADIRCEIIHIDEEWEEVKEPVSFMEAVEAFDEGEDIYCLLEGEKYVYRSCNFGLVEEENKTPITPVEILKGEWYIGWEDK